MKFSYKKLWLLLLEYEINEATIRNEIGLSAGTYTKAELRRGSFPLHSAEDMLIYELRGCSKISPDYRTVNMPRFKMDKRIKGTIYGRRI